MIPLAGVRVSKHSLEPKIPTHCTGNNLLRLIEEMFGALQPRNSRLGVPSDASLTWFQGVSVSISISSLGRALQAHVIAPTCSILAKLSSVKKSACSPTNEFHSSGISTITTILLNYMYLFRYRQGISIESQLQHFICNRPSSCGNFENL